jgi:glycosyltransferase involved in cell wall biosynthesis
MTAEDRGLVACVLTLNEERHVERAIRSLTGAVDRVVVVDSGSTDRTCALARSAGASVLTRPFTGYADQRNWALGEIGARFGGRWIFTMDADEWLSPELHQELASFDPRTAAHDVLLVRRRTRFAGRVLRHGGFGTTWLARLVRSGFTRYEERGVNEHLVIPAGTRVGRLRGWLEHGDVDSWSAYIDKHNRYSTLEAQARVDAERQPGSRPDLRTAWRDRTLRRRYLRQGIYERLPARPALRFLASYVALGGFLDGRAGFDRALFEAWQELCIDRKADELRRDLR